TPRTSVLSFDSLCVSVRSSHFGKIELLPLLTVVALSVRHAEPYLFGIQTAAEAGRLYAGFAGMRSMLGLTWVSYRGTVACRRRDALLSTSASGHDVEVKRR